VDPSQTTNDDDQAAEAHQQELELRHREEEELLKADDKAYGEFLEKLSADWHDDISERRDWERMMYGWSKYDR
jgi:hypothetical protein